MAGSVVRTVGHGGVGGDLTPTMKRAAFVLSDGSRAVVVADPNQNNITGDGGDNTNIAKFYVYTSPDGVTWTLRATVTPTATPLANAVTFGACIGTNNNIHIAWRTTAGGIAYRMLTFAAGPAYTVGAEETVLASNPANSSTGYVRRIDMDVAGVNNNAVIAAWCVLNTSATLSNRRMELRAFTRSNTPSWVAAATTPFSPASQWNYTGAEDISIAADSAGPDGSNNINCCIYLERKRNDGADIGDMIYCYRTNVATGAMVSMTLITPTALTTIGLNAGYGGGFRTCWVFPSAAGEFTVVGIISINPQITVFAWRFTLSSSAVRTDVIPPTRIPMTSNGPFDKTSVLYQWGGVSYGNETAVCYGRGTDDQIFGIPLRFSRSPNSVQAGIAKRWDSFYTFGGAGAQAIVATGNNRNFTLNKHDVVWFSGLGNGINWYKYEWFTAKVPLIPRNVIPASGANSSTDRPVLGADHVWGPQVAPLRTKMQWQLASDAGFSTNLRTITEADTDFIFAENTNSPTLAKVPTTETVPAVSELFQGSWFIRARGVTELNDFGAWSTGTSFNVSHQPSAANTFPKADAIFNYGAFGNVTFSWKFTDPSPFDSQTAFNIVVEDNLSGVQILDSGKVSSTVQSATLSIPSPGKDIQLRWKMRLWDSDDVVGPFSSYQTFFVVDNPAVTINFPSALSTNILSSDDSTFEATIGSWVSVSNANAPVRSTAQFHSGVASGQFTATAAGTVVVGTGNTLYPCYSGQELSEGGWSRANTTGRSVKMVFKFYDVSGTFMSGFDVSGTPVTDSTTGWTQIPTLTTFAPVGAVTYRVTVQRDSMTLGESFFLDDMISGDTGNINTAVPKVAWTTTIGGGRTQKNFRVMITQGATTVYDSGWKLGPDQSWAIPLGYLLNLQNYSVVVSIRDNLDLENSAVQTFSTVWNLPAAPSFSVGNAQYETQGFVSVTWTNAAIDPDFVSWNVYRRKVGAVDWDLISQQFVDSPTFEVDDYLAGSNQQYQYVVVQQVDRFGSQVESLYTPTLITPISTVYWLIHPDNSALSMPLRFVTDDPYTVEYDQVTYNVIGRGRKADYGDRWGVAGTVTAKLRDIAGGLTARQQREALLQLRDEQRSVYLRNPFGDVWQVAMGNIGVGRIAGVSLAEYVDVEIPYAEVAE